MTGIAFLPDRHEKADEQKGNTSSAKTESIA